MGSDIHYVSQKDEGVCDGTWTVLDQSSLSQPGCQSQLHLNGPRAEGSDEYALLNYYDDFPQSKKYAAINPQLFKMELSHTIRARKRNDAELPDEVEVFGILADGMNMTPSDAESLDNEEVS